MYPGLPSRLEKEVKQLYLTNVLGGDASRLNVSGGKGTKLMSMKLFCTDIRFCFYRNSRYALKIPQDASTCLYPSDI